MIAQFEDEAWSMLRTPQLVFIVIVTLTTYMSAVCCLGLFYFYTAVLPKYAKMAAAADDGAIFGF